MKLPPWIGHVFRAAFAVLVIGVLIRSGALKPALLAEAVTRHPGFYALAVLLYFVPVQIFAWLRWYLLLRAAAVRISVFESLRLHMTGLFFNGFLPGGTGGDLAKGWYLLKGRSKADAAAALGTLVVDRVIGLFGLIGLAAAANWIGRDVWSASPVLATQSLFIFSLTGVLVMLTIGYLFPWNTGTLFRKRRARKDGEEKRRRGFLAEFALALGSFRKHPGVFLGGIALSVGVHFLLVIVYALCANALDVSLPFRLHAYVAPTLTFANGLPISPAGLGVGEAAGMLLYKAVGASHGFAEIPALVHTIGLLIALLCAPAYLLRRDSRPRDV